MSAMLILYDLDIPQSVRKGRLRRKAKPGGKKPHTLSDAVTNVFLIISAIAVLAGLPLGLYRLGEISALFLAVALLLAAVVIPALIYALLNEDKLRRINGISPDANRRAVQALENHPHFRKSYDNRAFAAYQYKNQELIIIYHQDQLLLNSLTYSKGSLTFPFSWFANRRAEKRAIQAIQNELYSLAADKAIQHSKAQ